MHTYIAAAEPLTLKAESFDRVEPRRMRLLDLFREEHEYVAN